jgi:hypothetical protein
MVRAGAPNCAGELEGCRWVVLATAEFAPVLLERAAAPHLVVIGRRGWECEQVVDMLERCLGLRGRAPVLATQFRRGYLLCRKEVDDARISKY